MASIQRPLEGTALRFDLADEIVRTPAALHTGRSARTLVKAGPLRVTLVHMAPGGLLAEHQAPGPVTIQVLAGSISVTVAGEEHVMGPGTLLSLRPGVRHSVRSVAGGEFLLTLARAVGKMPVKDGW
jgi:quercetin dioxygenase-like cupin family protein